MKTFASKSVKIALIFCVLFEVRAQDTNDTQCVDNGLTPDDEYGLEDGTFYAFASQLEKYTGFGETPVSVTLNCSDTPCIVNYNGDAIWEARMELYSNNMMSNVDQGNYFNLWAANNDLKTTLDGCLCHSTDAEDFQNCMNQVRENMITQLDTVLVEKFREILEGDCGLLEQNCVM